MLYTTPPGFMTIFDQFDLEHDGLITAEEYEALSSNTQILILLCIYIYIYMYVCVHIYIYIYIHMYM